jgi:iron complex outermembrane receptor protein
MQKLKQKQYDFCFRRWTRKSYGAFASLHKIVKMGVIQVFFSIVTMQSLTLYAQDTLTAPRVYDLDEVVVAGLREDALPNVVRVVTTLTRAEIDAAPALTLNELLRTLPSLDLRQRGPLGTQADLSIRGGTCDQTQILINGVNFTDPQTGHHNLNLPIDLSSVSNLEVMQGLSAPGAIGGAVNLTTGSKVLNTAALSLSGGRWGYANISGNASVGNKKLHAFFAASHQQSEGYVANTDFRTANFFTHVRYFSPVGRFEAQVGYQDKDFGSYGFYSFRYPNQFEHTRALLSSLRWQHTVGAFDFTATAYYRRHNDRFELVRSTLTGRNDHQTDVAGGEFTAGLHTFLGQTVFSAEFRDEHIYSTVLGEPMITPKPVPFEQDVLFTHEADRKIFRGLLSHTYTYQRFGISAGLSYHYSNDFNSKVCLAADARYRWNDFFLSYAAVNQSLRLPTFTDLYYQTATHEANPAVKPEEALTYEIGSAYTKRAFNASLAVFYRQGQNLIDWVYVQNLAKSQSRNYTHLDAMGAELQLQWTPAKVDKRRFLHMLGFAYSFTYLDRDAGNTVSSYALDYLRHKVNVNLTHGVFFPQLTAAWQLAVQDRAGNYADVQTGDVKPFEPFTLLNLKLSWDEKHFTLFAEANNIFDVAYFDYAGLVQPGFWLTAGVKVKLF